MVDAEFFDITNKKELFLTEDEYFRIKNEGGWHNEFFELIEKINKVCKINSKNPKFQNTLAYTNFLRENHDFCFVKGNLSETVRRFKEKIFENPETKELFTREMKDFYYIIERYINEFKKYKKGKKIFLLPQRKGSWKYSNLKKEDIPKDINGDYKNGWANLNLSKRKKINEYIFIKEDLLKRKIDQQMFDNIHILENIPNEKICEWVEYMGLWSTAVGVGAEIFVKEQLEKYVKDIKWRWPTNEEDVNNYDIVGEVDNVVIPIQVKLAQSARIGERGLDVSKIFVLYCKEVGRYGNYKICPIKFSPNGWISLFNRIYNDVKKGVIT